ncbi:hypothetical protein SPRG_06565 [Saprolegnia parasitica CBS 223.65]|uniref:Ubiquitin-like protease family profile domain-containing protein n=1 Tax=Saprolegnia parasitica (strain CBS 223.65) TaxID=695850 RepID=A0A067CND4_SAPPC|nr:hypothetical protein SPRG_06565 [Saprolegnia parasitica CBS 223.65]KDO28327.1 hypothetical protein SPRG_06565 [Saprolegnia parasitica CBS 223.65]|eukprot:XP_012200776.1 hypothetical protein SPRG_06565 [Saprolegnia parasitica CBS 223.65]
MRACAASVTLSTTYRRFLWLKESTCAVVNNGNRFQWGDELAFTLVIRDAVLVFTDVDGPQAQELGLRSGDVLRFITMAEKVVAPDAILKVLSAWTGMEALYIAIGTPDNEISEVAKGRMSTCKGKTAVVSTGWYCKSEDRLKVGDLLRKYKMRKRGAHTWFEKVVKVKKFHLWYGEEDDESNTKTPDYFYTAVHHDEIAALYAAWLKSADCKWMFPNGPPKRVLKRKALEERPESASKRKATAATPIDRLKRQKSPKGEDASKKVDMVAKVTVLLFCAGFHFWLEVVEDGIAYILDSMPGNTNDGFRRCCTQGHQANFKVKSVNVKKQTGGIDCGLHLLGNLDEDESSMKDFKSVKGFISRAALRVKIHDLALLEIMALETKYWGLHGPTNIYRPCFTESKLSAAQISISWVCKPGAVLKSKDKKSTLKDNTLVEFKRNDEYFQRLKPYKSDYTEEQWLELEEMHK